MTFKQLRITKKLDFTDFHRKKVTNSYFCQNPQENEILTGYLLIMKGNAYHNIHKKFQVHGSYFWSRSKNKYRQVATITHLPYLWQPTYLYPQGRVVKIRWNDRKGRSHICSHLMAELKILAGRDKSFRGKGVVTTFLYRHTPWCRIEGALKIFKICRGSRTRLPKFKFSAKFPISLHVILQIQIRKFENDCYVCEKLF